MHDKMDFEFLRSVLEATDKAVSDDVYGKVNHWAIHKTVQLMDDMRRDGVVNDEIVFGDIFQYAFDKHGSERACLVTRAADMTREFMAYDALVNKSNHGEFVVQAVDCSIGLSLREAVKGVFVLYNEESGEFIVIAPSKECDKMDDHGKLTMIGDMINVFELLLDFDPDEYFKNEDEED